MTGKRDTIVAVASGTGGAIALIRLSGPTAIAIGDRIFTGVSGSPLSRSKGFTIHFGHIRNEADEIIDDVLVSLFRTPRSYTGEDMLEISCHGSPFIQQEILRLCIREGARMAQGGEFTLKAFLAGKMDLSQAEAVADIIASDSRAALTLATRQIRGGYSEEFTDLRQQLLELTSLLELELDFSEEDVEFADRTRLSVMLTEIEHRISSLSDSFRLGNILKNGVPVAIIGSPNVGKSTLLNALLNEERALVSDIAGTTRDLIEETINIQGVTFRFIDTAGIRDTADPLEHMGIERTLQRVRQAAIILLMVDANDPSEQIEAQLRSIPVGDGQQIALILNKADKATEEQIALLKKTLQQKNALPVLSISAKQKDNLQALTSLLYDSVHADESLRSGQLIVSNARHHEALEAAREATHRAQNGLTEGIPGDLLAQDIREVLYHLGTITGEITSQDILNSIFSKFCVGK